MGAAIWEEVTLYLETGAGLVKHECRAKLFHLTNGSVVPCEDGNNWEGTVNAKKKEK